MLVVVLCGENRSSCRSSSGENKEVSRKRRGTLLHYLLPSLSLLDFVFHNPCIPFETGKGSFSWCSACVELVLGLSMQPSTFSSSECVVADLTAPVIQQSYAAVFFTEGTGWRARI